MVRTIAGYAFIGVVGIIAVKLAFGVVGMVFSLVWAILALAGIGFVFYLILRIVNPEAARSMREKISRKPKEES